LKFFKNLHFCFKYNKSKLHKKGYNQLIY
jgi:hypothetical protein